MLGGVLAELGGWGGLPTAALVEEDNAVDGWVEKNSVADGGITTRSAVEEDH